MGETYGCRWCSGDGTPVEELLERPLLDKLGDEVDRYQSKEFLKAAMAVCALTAMADEEVKIEERCGINYAIRTEPAFRSFDVEKATQIMDEYIIAIGRDHQLAKPVLYGKVRQMAGDRKLARTLMRVSYLIITADHDVDEREVGEFKRLCRVLDLDPDNVWGDAEVWSRDREPSKHS
ncbi:MAG: tellurite resistance TerB family protein [Proteobacteria bacterium]|nr:tellurite resistance TerB family protein [Pseudomonadota bacterium]